MVSMPFQHKVALITGAASGIGKLAAGEFARQGAAVILSDVNESTGAEVAETIRRGGGKSLFVRCDVSQAAQVEAMVEAGMREFGQLDFCLNNAGISGGTMKTVTHLYEEETWDNVLDINAKGVWLCMKYELPHLVRQKSGAIVNVASVAGLTAVPGNIAYAASKHAVVGMTKTAALEYVRHNIRINAVCPVFTDTPMVQDSIMTDPEYAEKLIKSIPMRRLATPLEIVNVILFLCSEQASFMTGKAIPIDGGML